MPDKFYYYGPPPTPEDVNRGIKIFFFLLFGIPLLIAGGFLLGGIGQAFGWPGSTIGSWFNSVETFFNDIGNRNINDILILLLILFIVSHALFGAIFVMRRSESTLGCGLFIALCLVILVGGIGISAWELLRPSSTTSPSQTQLFYAGESWTGQLSLRDSSRAPIPVSLTIQSIQGNSFRGTLRGPGGSTNVTGTLGSSLSDFSSDGQSAIQDVMNSFGSGEYIEFIMSSDNNRFAAVLEQNGELKGFDYDLGLTISPQSPVGTYDLQKIS